MGGKKKSEVIEANANANKVAKGELAVRLTRDVSGGLGNHSEGDVLRNLSGSAFNTLVQGGLGEALSEGDDVSDAVDAAQPLAPTTGDGDGVVDGGGSGDE